MTKLLSFDSRGHDKIRALLEDISEDTILVAGDCLFHDVHNRIHLAEVKELGDFLTSFSSGRLYNQMRAMQEIAEVTYLILQGIYHPTREGYLTVNKFLTRWKYSSVMGIIVDIFLRGTLVISSNSDYSTAIIIRSLVKQATEQKRPEIRIPKVFSYREREEVPMRLLCSITDVNIVRAQNLLRRFHNIKRIAMATEEELMEVPDIGEKIAKGIWDAFDEWGKYE